MHWMGEWLRRTFLSGELARCFLGFGQDESEELGSLGSSSKEMVALSSRLGSEADTWGTIEASRADTPTFLCLW